MNATSVSIEAAGSHVALLHKISNIVHSGDDLEEILRDLVGLTMNVTQSDACLAYLLEPSSGDLVLRASQLPHKKEIGKVRLKAGEGITGWVAEHNSVVALAKDASSDARFRRFRSLEEDTYEAFLSVPLACEGELIGVINVHHRDSRQHTPDEIALVTFIGEQLGGVIGRRRLAEQSRTATRRLETLAAVAQTISGENYLERILQAIAEMAAETLDGALCSILLADDQARDLEVNVARCSAPEYLHRMPMKMEGSVMERVMKDGQPLTVRDIQKDTQYKYPELSRKNGLTSMLAAPLFSQGKAIGVICVYTANTRTFGEDEMGFIRVIGGQAATAIENARLMSETLEMKRQLETRKVVERAKGILQARQNLSEEEAYLKLRNESRRLRRPMKDLAEAIILADDLNRRENTTGRPPAREDAELT
jgi:uroporphyrinogen-III synthase